jgi:peroxiredoxin
MMRKIFILAIITIYTLSCSQNSQYAKIEGKIEGLSDGELVLRKLEINTQRTIDTIKTKEGKFSYRVKKSSSSPEFYYIYHKERKLSSLILLPGDKVTISADTLGFNQSVEGSQESTLLIELEKRLSQAQRRFDSLKYEMDAANVAGNARRSNEINYELGSLYVKQKQEAIKYIYKNPHSLTNMILLYHRFSPEVPLFADLRDVMLFKRVYDSLIVVYPSSQYLTSLSGEINMREKEEIINSKISEAANLGFPDLTLPDNKAVMQTLSNLSGKVVILSFWSVNDPAQRMMNQELKELYNMFHSRGLEIYQVSADTDKTAWARAVSEQALPWISVCDGLGSRSVAISTYNIQKLPSNFIIDREGTIVARDIFDSQLERKIASLIR